MIEIVNKKPTIELTASLGEGYSMGYEQGKQAEYDNFWDAYQNYGKRTEYSRAFYSSNWSDRIFNPKYELVVTNATEMFNNARIIGHEKLLTADFSKCTGFDRAFCQSTIEELGVIDLSSLRGSLSQTFHQAQVKKIGKVICNENTKFSSTAFQTITLIDVTFEGVIGQTIVLSSAPLNRASILSCISVLSDTAIGMSASFNKKAVNIAFETEKGKADGSSSAEWLNIVASKPNWTIALV